jgi:hypothetical protein
MNLRHWLAFWHAHPAAPETSLLRRGRFGFLLTSFGLFGLTLLPDRVWRPYPGFILVVPLLGIVALLTGARYFASKAKADEQHRDTLIQRSDARALERERP